MVPAPESFLELPTITPPEQLLGAISFVGFLLSKQDLQDEEAESREAFLPNGV